MYVDIIYQITEPPHLQKSYVVIRNKRWHIGNNKHNDLQIRLNFSGSLESVISLGI